MDVSNPDGPDEDYRLFGSHLNGDQVLIKGGMPSGKWRKSVYIGPIPNSNGWHICRDEEVRPGKGGTPRIYEVHSDDIKSK